MSATAVASAALLAGALGAPATAADRTPSATPLAMSVSLRADLLKEAKADTAETARTLGLGAQEELHVKDVVKDRDGTVHTRYDRTYQGLKVLGGDLVVHTAKGGKQLGVNRASKAELQVDTSPKTLKAAPENATKVVWAPRHGSPVLAYESVAKSVEKDGTPSETHTVTDATSGARLASWDAVETGLGHSEYNGDVEIGTSPASGGGYELTDADRGGHKTYDLGNSSAGTGTLFTDDDDEWGDGTASDPQTAAVDAAYGAAETWDYYKDVHGRSGIAGDGKGATSRVHYGNNYVNAFWQDSCFCMTYGDGAGNAAPLTALDVAAHEMSHGVTAATAGLIYSGESGGLNEATSDIMATAVEFYSNTDEDPGDYLIGEKIDINGDGSPLRYMDEPSKDGASRDYWSADLGNTDVHYSSGPANHFFYLLSEGSGAKTVNGVSYDSPTYDDSTVTGIGIEKAEQVWFKALSEYMTSTTDYADAREATLSAAGDLYGTDSTEYAAVDAAWAAINVS
ncbi:M4 family metallopeptidase [Streptomyces sp. P6-2-1]|uniref:M4 family metallopeptidase n=1 Tax=unclassified Streptomyces TaxID=2593676 RepID=UPI003D36F864